MLSQASWLEGVQQDLITAVRGRLDGEKHRLQSLVQRIPVATALFMQGQHHRLDLWQKYMDAASPEHVLALGYSITRVNGRAVRSIAEISPGDRVTTTVAGGEFTGTVTDKTEYDG
jgi:exodeoxyribonuclease VII large subunit